MANHASTFRRGMPQADFVLIGHHRQMNGHIEALFSLRQRHLVGLVDRPPEQFCQFSDFHIIIGID